MQGTPEGHWLEWDLDSVPRHVVMMRMYSMMNRYIGGALRHRKNGKGKSNMTNAKGIVSLQSEAIERGEVGE